jgi:hypothetical protein
MQGLFTDTMHGSIFIFLKRYIESKYNYSTWVSIIQNQGLNRLDVPYQMNEVYPISELFTIMAEGARIGGITYHEFQEKFGKFLVPDLLLVFKRFINPDWRTYDMLQYVGSHMHGGIKKESSNTNPPPLHVSKVGKHTLILDYYSKRKMAGFAVGIIKGLAGYFQEEERVRVIPPADMLAERVQIRVEFSS